MADTMVPSEQLESKVDSLLDRLERERGHFSSVRKMTRHPAFNEIISLGPCVLPVLLKKLKNDQNVHVAMAAVSMITNEGPEIPEAYRGVIPEMVKLYIAFLMRLGCGP